MTAPPGQRPRSDFPRFGLPPYADRFPTDPDSRTLIIGLPGADPFPVHLDTVGLERVSRRSDFHCVTTWSRLDVPWGGIRFAELYRTRIEPRLAEGPAIRGVALHAQDGYATALLLEDLLDDDVLLADELDGRPLSVEHGAPLRLVAPGHYGYKNLKHLERMTFHADVPELKKGLRRLLDHPRARVEHEERGRWGPGWLLRRVYRPMIPRTVRRFERAMARYGGARA